MSKVLTLMVPAETLAGQKPTGYCVNLDQRRRGSPDGSAPPEELTDNSPLLRDLTNHTPRPIGPKQIRRLVRPLYVKAGLAKAPTGACTSSVSIAVVLT